MSDTDIVSRLRHEADQWHPSEKSPIRQLREGADRIEALERECERLRAGRAAVWAECRETCAKICDEFDNPHNDGQPALAAAIRRAIRALEVPNE